MSSCLVAGEWLNSLTRISWEWRIHAFPHSSSFLQSTDNPYGISMAIITSCERDFIPIDLLAIAFKPATINLVVSVREMKFYGRVCLSWVTRIADSVCVQSSPRYIVGIPVFMWTRFPDKKKQLLTGTNTNSRISHEAFVNEILLVRATAVPNKRGLQEWTINQKLHLE